MNRLEYVRKMNYERNGKKFDPPVITRRTFIVDTWPSSKQTSVIVTYYSWSYDDTPPQVCCVKQFIMPVKEHFMKTRLSEG